MNSFPELLVRAQNYARRRGLLLGDPLGSGVHGSVFAAENQIQAIQLAVKIHAREPDYRRERDVYLRLQEHNVCEICQCAVPQLLGYDDELLALEMTLVTRPFLLDFGDANLDQAHDFSEEVLADWRADKKELFERRWLDVQTILRYLEGYGIYMLDVHPGNISFDD